MKQPVDHILRPRLPWRPASEGAITECGFDASKVQTIGRAEYFARVKDMGQPRAALFTCMTCGDTAKRWGTWDDDPCLAMQREIEWERGGHYWRGREDRGQLLKDELLAIDHLIEAHRAEFDAHVAGTIQRRDWVEKKAALQGRAKPQRKRGGL